MGDFHRNACYGSSLNMMQQNQNTAKYSIILVTSDRFYSATSYNNYCWMSKHQLENYLRRISTIKHFTYKVSESEYEGYPCHKIDLTIVGTRKEITFVLQCIKRTYEWPYNLYLNQAYELQKLPAFRFDSILNLFNVAFSAYSSSINTDHCFSGNTKFEKYATLKEKLPNITSAVQLFPDAVRVTKRAPKVEGVQYQGDIPCNTEQWGEELCRRVLPTYIENYHELKR
jgi:hypothetical protein